MVGDCVPFITSVGPASRRNHGWRASAAAAWLCMSTVEMAPGIFGRQTDRAGSGFDQVVSAARRPHGQLIDDNDESGPGCHLDPLNCANATWSGHRDHKQARGTLRNIRAKGIQL